MPRLSKQRKAAKTQAYQLDDDKIFFHNAMQDNPNFGFTQTA
jgi:hypothetical protein